MWWCHHSYFWSEAASFFGTHPLLQPFSTWSEWSWPLLKRSHRGWLGVGRRIYPHCGHVPFRAWPAASVAWFWARRAGLQSLDCCGDIAVPWRVPPGVLWPLLSYVTALYWYLLGRTRKCTENFFMLECSSSLKLVAILCALQDGLTQGLVLPFLGACCL